MVYTKLKQTIVSILNYFDSGTDKSVTKWPCEMPVQVDSEKSSLVETMMSTNKQRCHEVENMFPAAELVTETKNILAAVEKHFN